MSGLAAKAEFSEKYRALRNNFAKKLPGRLEEMASALRQAKNMKASGEPCSRAITIADQIRGTAGSFGFNDVASDLVVIERILLDFRRDGKIPDWNEIEALMLRLRERVDRGDGDDPPEIKEQQKSSFKRSPAPAKSRGCVGVLDDDRVFLAMVNEMLTAHGFEVLRARNQQEFKELLDAEPDLLLLDVEMPDANGFDLCKRLRTEPKWETIPILFLTAHQDLDSRVLAFSSGGDDFITKPIVARELVARIQVRLERLELLKDYRNAMVRIERSRQDLLAVMNRLKLGVMILDPDGRITFSNEPCRNMLGLNQQIEDMHWDQLKMFDKTVRKNLKRMGNLPQNKRERVQITLTRDANEYMLEVDLVDDPHDREGRILYFSDITEVYRLRQQLKPHRLLTGNSRAMHALNDQVRKVGPGEWPLTIEGETGSGKERIAKAIHEESKRSRYPFVRLNCLGLPEEELILRLFGALTPKGARRQSAFEQAEGGTLYLSEFNEIPLSQQARLANILRTGEFTPAGQLHPIKLNVRIITGSRKDIDTELKADRLDEDLFYAISVTRIKAPPLRDRPEDIPALLDEFLSQAADKKPQISADVLDILQRYTWPGNTQELSNVAKHALMHCRKGLIIPDHLPEDLRQMVSMGADHPENRDLERRRILAALEEAHGNRTQAARILGIGRATLYRRLADLDISP